MHIPDAKKNIPTKIQRLWGSRQSKLVCTCIPLSALHLHLYMHTYIGKYKKLCFYIGSTTQCNDGTQWRSEAVNQNFFPLSYSSCDEIFPCFQYIFLDTCTYALTFCAPFHHRSAIHYFMRMYILHTYTYIQNLR